MKKLTLAITMAAAMVASTMTSYGVATLTLTSGATTIIVTDGSALDFNPGIGAVTYIGPVGGVWASVDTGLSKGTIGSPTVPAMTLTLNDTSSAAAATLEIWWSDDDFGPLGNLNFNASGGGTMQLSGGGTADYSTWGDTGNAINGDDGTTAQSTQNYVPDAVGSFSGSTAAPVGGPLAFPYSLTMYVKIVHNTAGNSTGGYQLTAVPVPDGGSTLLLLGSALGALGIVNWRRKK